MEKLARGSEGAQDPWELQVCPKNHFFCGYGIPVSLQGCSWHCSELRHLEACSVLAGGLHLFGKGSGVQFLGFQAENMATKRLVDVAIRFNVVFMA